MTVPAQQKDQAPPRTHYTVAEVASALSLSTKAVYRMVDAGQLRSTRFGRAVRIPVAAFDALIADAA